MDALGDPVLIGGLGLVGLAALRFGLRWIAFRLLLSILLRPIPLFLIAVAVAAAFKSG